MENFEKIKELISSTEVDLVKFFEKGNSDAGTRVRKAMQELKNLAQEVRIDIQDKKNS